MSQRYLDRSCVHVLGKVEWVPRKSGTLPGPSTYRAVLATFGPAIVENPLDTIVNMHHAHQWDSTAALLRTGSAPTGHDTRWAQAMAFIAAGHRDDAHLVASVLVIDAEGLVLLARHRRYGRWGPLGGHLEEADAGLPDAAARELLEEAALLARVLPALDVHLSTYRCRTTSEPVAHLDVLFVASVGGCAPALTASDEVRELRWCTARDLPEPVLPGIAELISVATALSAQSGAPRVRDLRR
jgi:8-oxo-dGTP pyrophosphatase MutT (NUDIX family)